MVYRLLFTHQIADQLAENDKVCYDLLTAAVDFNNFLQFNNTKGIKGEVAAGGTYKSLVVLDSGNVVQLGEAGTEVRVPADPSNALGVATKQYVDGVQMFQTQAKVSASPALSSAFATILNIAATTRGRVKSISFKTGSGGTVTVSAIRITIDGGTPVTISPDVEPAADNWRSLNVNLLWSAADAATEEGLGSNNIDIAFNTSLLIEASTRFAAGTPLCKVVYEKIP